MEPIRSQRVPPLVVPESDVDMSRKFTPANSPAVWVRLTYTDGAVHEVPGFALAWTRAHVLVQIPWPEEYYDGHRDSWVPATGVRRRQIDRRVR
ncbi:hypothetical protein KKI43_20305 [Arthrobacter sp. GN70]|nr:hypothetical protein [Arthrobacter sp. GN70]